MAAFLLTTIVMAAFWLPAATLTAFLALMIRGFQLAPGKPVLRTVLAGSVTPFALLSYGLVLSWPWPWRLVMERYDMVPLGPGLVIAALPAWLLSLLLSWVVLRRP